MYVVFDIAANRADGDQERRRMGLFAFPESGGAKGGAAGDGDADLYGDGDDEEDLYS